MHPFEQGEDAIITALAPLKNEGVKDIEPYVGQFDVEKLEELLPRFPGIFVAGGEVQVPEADNTGRIKLGFTLLVGDQNRRGMKESVRGDASRPGVYRMLSRCQDLLHRKHVVNGWRSFRLVSERALIYLPKKKVCIFNAFYTTEI